MSKNLVKQVFTVASPEEEKRIIDSNELVRKRLEELSRQNSQFKTGGFVSGLGNLEVVELPENDGTEEEDRVSAEEEAEAILEQARAHAEELLTEAEEKAARIVDEARQEAEGQKKQILEQAREKGYQEGYAKAKAHEDAMEQEYLQKHQALEEEYQQQLDILEPEFVDIITGIYEHIFHVELSSNRQVLSYLISDTIRNQEDSRMFMIHVSKEDYAYVNMQKKQMLAGAVSESANVDVVEDLTLSKNQCLIETENGIFDCGLGTQLAELKQKLRILSWSREMQP